MSGQGQSHLEKENIFLRVNHMMVSAKRKMSYSTPSPKKKKLFY
jgi:hypothetical protein